jgi:hypothetical protein
MLTDDPAKLMGVGFSKVGNGREAALNCLENLNR